MLENFGGLRTAYDAREALNQAENMDYDYVYGDNAPVQDYVGLIMDVGRNAALLAEHVDRFPVGWDYPPHGYAVQSTQSQHTSGWIDTALTLLGSHNAMSAMQDPDYLNGDFGGEEGMALRDCIKAAQSLSKKQILELFPALCELMLSVQITCAASEMLEECLKEVYEQNKALGEQGA